MTMLDDGARGEWTTVTHARLRADQGDVRGARRVLGEILEAEPDHAEALDLLRTLEDAVQRETQPEVEIRLAPAIGAGAADLSDRFREVLGADGDFRERRVRRLRRWLRRIETVRRHRHA